MPILRPEERIGAILADRYRLDHIIGRGGMGVVFAATHTRTLAKLAIKLLLPEYAENAELLARFFQEAEATGALEHPNVIRVIDCGESDEGDAYIALELLHGRTLHEWLSERVEKKLTPSLAIKLCIPVVDALAAVHAKDIAHRDLKPANIFLHTYDGVLVPKLLDFGIAKLTRGSVLKTSTGHTLGTPSYMSPEQAGSGDTKGTPVDVWAIGVLLFQLLAGRLPLEINDQAQMLVKIATQAPPLLRDAAPELPHELCDAIQAALQMKPDARPSMVDFGKRLRDTATLLGMDLAGPVTHECLQSPYRPFSSTTHTVQQVSANDAAPNKQHAHEQRAHATVASSEEKPPAEYVTNHVGTETSNAPPPAHQVPIETNHSTTLPTAAASLKDGEAHADATHITDVHAPMEARLLRRWLWFGTIIGLISLSSALWFGILPMDSPSVSSNSPDPPTRSTATTHREMQNGEVDHSSSEESVEEVQLLASDDNSLVLSVDVNRDGSQLALLRSTGLSLHSLQTPSTPPCPIRLPTNLEALSAWYLPTGTLLLVGQNNEQQGELWEVGQGIEPQRLRRGPFSRAWPSDDGQRVASLSGGILRIHSLAPENRSQEPIQIASLRPNEHITTLDWSDDGETIAYIRAVYGESGASLLEAVTDGSEMRTLLNDPMLELPGNRAAVLYHDNAILAARSADHGTSTQIISVARERNATPHVRYVLRASAATHLNASPEGVLLTRWQEHRDIIVRPLAEGGEFVPWTSNEHNNTPSYFSPEGSLIFNSDRSGPWTLFQQDSQNSPAIALTMGDVSETWPVAFRQARLFWRLAVDSEDRTGGQCALIRRDLTTRMERMLFEVDIEHLASLEGSPPPLAYSFRCTPQAVCMLMRRGRGDVRFTPFDSQSGEHSEGQTFQTQGTVVQDWTLRDDARQLAFVNGGPEITLVDLEQNRRQTVNIHPPSALIHLTYGRRSNTLFVVSLIGSHWRLLRVAENGDTSTLLEQTNGSITQPVVSRTTLAVSQRIDRSEVWLLRGL